MTVIGSWGHCRWLGLLVVLLVDCQSRDASLLPLTHGDSTTTSGSAGGSSGTTSTTTTGSGTTGTAGSTTAGSSGALTTSGSTGSPGQFCVWVKDVCALRSCDDATIGATCALDGGGLGLCHGGQCTDLDFSNDPRNCGGFGIVCPDDIPCIGMSCGPPAIDCTTDGGGCPPGYTCWYGYPASVCIPSDCSFASNDDSCLADGWNTAGTFCCNGQCATGDSSNCGGCGVICGPGTVCSYDLHGTSCVPSTPCGPESVAGWSNSNPVACTLPSGELGQCCGGECFDLLDPNHCHSCGVACPGGGACDPDGWCLTYCMGDADCPDGYTCPYQTYCQLIRCDPGSDGVPCTVGSGGVCCGERCVDRGSDPTNCGRCGALCNAGESCLGGECVTFAPPGADYQYCAMADGGLGTYCDQSCVDRWVDAAHCTFCDRPCPTGATCVAGTCSLGCAHDADCPSGFVCDAAHGQCMPPCNSTNPFCDFGQLTCCGSTCVDTTSDPANCGSCGFPCPIAPGISCVSGQCVLPDGGAPDCLSGCPLGFSCAHSPAFPPWEACLPTLCEPDDTGGPCALGESLGTCCGGLCIDTRSDPLNCGSCGIECPSGYCSSAVCVDTPVVDGCSESCGPNTTCADGICVDSRCENLASTRCLAEDGAVGVCCGGSFIYTSPCADLSSDPYNCGACGITCPAGAICTAGKCVAS
jgi:hypothetical protein